MINSLSYNALKVSRTEKLSSGVVLFKKTHYLCSMMEFGSCRLATICIRTEPVMEKLYEGQEKNIMVEIYPG